MRRYFLHLLGLAVTAALLVGCGTPPLADQDNEATAGAVEYTIGPGDTLQIYVRNNPDLSVTLPVRPDGRISVPMVQDVEAAGKTPSGLASDLEGELAEFIRSPNVSVMVMAFVGAYSDQVRIVGQAVEPQALAYRDGMTLLDAIIEVGGLTQFAAGNRAKLVRKTDSGNDTFRVRLGDLINDGDISANVRLYPGDIVIIPEAFF